MIPQRDSEGNELVEIRGPQGTAWVAPEHAERLRHHLTREDPSAWPGLVEVKRSQVRTVLRTELATEDGPLAVHLKLFRAVRLSDRARDAARGSRAERELHNLATGRARGVPCIEPLAAGRSTGSFGARSFLLTRSEPGAPLPRAALPADVAHRTGQLLRLAHDRGLHARDLHPGNVLCRPDGSLLLLDLTSATWAQPLPWDERARALAYFCGDLDGNVRDPEAAPLLAGYQAPDSCVARAARQGARLRHRALSAFGRRAGRTCQHTDAQRKRKERWFWHRPAEPLHEAARALLEAPPPPHKHGRRGAVHLTDTLVMKDREAAAARHLFRAAYWLAFAGVPCAQPVVLRVAGGRGQLVSARLPHPNLKDELARGLDPACVRRAARQLGCAVGRLHAHGLRNRDLKLENLVRDPETDRVAVVDLDGVRRKAPIDSRGQAADLGRLLAAFEHAGAPGGSGTRLAFLRGYTKARRDLLQPPRHGRHLLSLAGARASAWASAHRAPD